MNSEPRELCAVNRVDVHVVGFFFQHLKLSFYLLLATWILGSFLRDAFQLYEAFK